MAVILAYYNEIDPFAAAWLRELIADGQIAPGDVDERSIVDVEPADLVGYTQCHFFAGIGGWSYALRLAGWPDDRPVWTGSCPCQPFSAAGKRKGAADDRHLWPHWFRLIRECKPPVLFGEQVAAAIAHGWWDAVQHDMEGEGYAVGMAVLPACSVGAFHKRDRLWFVAESERTRTGRHAGSTLGAQAEVCGARDSDGMRCSDASLAGGATLGMDNSPSPRCDSAGSGAEGEARDEARLCRPEPGCATGSMAHAEHSGHRGTGRDASQPCGDQPDKRVSVGDSADGGMADSEHSLGRPELQADNDPRRRDGLGGSGNAGGMGYSLDPRLEGLTGDVNNRHQPGRLGANEARSASETGSPWLNPYWLYCRDGKLRPVERPAQSSLIGLADGLPDSLGLVRDASGQAYISPLLEKGVNRVGRLRGYGNAIVPQLAAEFVSAWVEAVL